MHPKGWFPENARKLCTYVLHLKIPHDTTPDNGFETDTLRNKGLKENPDRRQDDGSETLHNTYGTRRGECLIPEPQPFPVEVHPVG